MEEKEKIKFTHLHVHTEYSLLDGSAKIGELVLRAKELGMDSLAITDHGVMYGVIDFYKAAKAAGIKPIIGCEVYVAPGSRFDREVGKDDEKYYHLVLLAKNNKGYENLMKIVSVGAIEGFYYKPRVDKETLEKYSEGIIALSACLQGEVAVFLRKRLYDEAKKAALTYYNIFGEGNFYLEMQDHGIADQTLVNTDLMKMSKETKIPLVVTNDSHYIKAEDAEAHDILLCIQTNKKVHDTDRMKYDGGQFYLKSAEEMEKLFPYAKEAILNTNKIAEKCNVEIVFGEQKLPHFVVPDGYTSESYLEKICYDGLKERYDDITPEVLERLKYELGVIESMGFVDYFLIVWDFIRYARSRDIAVGPGRGSGAGSIVAYCLKITKLDPIKYGLIFERFLNPERVTMPDIDVDFCFERRHEVIEYVIEKYGKENVSQIIAFGTMAAKNCIRDVGRALDYPYNICDMVSKAIPTKLKDEKNVTLAACLKKSQDFRNIYDSDESIKKLIDMAMKLEGLPRHTTIHPAGVVICEEPIGNYVPLTKNGDGIVVTQYEAPLLEELGLLKMDFLAVRTLTVIDNAILNIERRTGIRIDIDEIDYSDKETYEMISSGKCEGVFQLESTGMRGFMKELRPRNLEDILAGIALYRPGPMDFIPKYLSYRLNPQEIEYDHPALEKILKPTYGCIVYQEQVMQIVMELAGYTMGMADNVRRAMSKKKVDVMKKERQYFIYGNEEMGVEGCIKRGVSAEVANKIFDEMMDFAKYAFNKSHAAAYAIVAFQTAYLKCHYSLDYMAALMTSVRDNTSKITLYIQSCRQMGIKVLPPDINKGIGVFTVDNDAIRYGMSAIKSVGDAAVSGIIADRKENGEFKDLADFINRLSNKEANKRTIESFIYAGAFDSFGKNRKQMKLVYPKLMEEAARDKKSRMTGQMSMMDFLGVEEKEAFTVNYPDVPEFTKEEILSNEKEVLGVYISGHPLDEYRDIIEKYTNARTIDFAIDDETKKTKVSDMINYTIGGAIENVSVKPTKNGTNMAFITLEDLYGTVEVIVFPKTYESYRNMIYANNKIIVKGRASVSDDGGKLLAGDILSFKDIEKRSADEAKQIWVLFENQEEFMKNQKQFVNVLNKFPGYSAVYVQLKEEKKGFYTRYKANIDDGVLEDLGKEWGYDHVIVRDTSKKKES